MFIIVKLTLWTVKNPAMMNLGRRYHISASITTMYKPLLTGLQELQLGSSLWQCTALHNRFVPSWSKAYWHPGLWCHMASLLDNGTLCNFPVETKNIVV